MGWRARRSAFWGDNAQEKQLKWLLTSLLSSFLVWSLLELFFWASKKPRSYQSGWLRKPLKRRGWPIAQQRRRNGAPPQAQTVGLCERLKSPSDYPVDGFVLGTTGMIYFAWERSPFALGFDLSLAFRRTTAFDAVATKSKTGPASMKRTENRKVLVSCF